MPSCENILRRCCALALLALALTTSPAAALTRDQIISEQYRFERLFNARRFDELLSQAPAYLRTVRDQIGESTGPYVTVLSAVGKAFYEINRLNESITVLNEVLRIYVKSKGPEDISIPPLLDDLSKVYWAMGRINEMISLQERALAILEKTRGPDDPEVATGLDNVATVYVNAGRYAQAEPFAKRALDIREKNPGPRSIEFAVSLNSLGQIYFQTHRYAEAEALFKRAVTVGRNARDVNHYTIEFVKDLGDLYVEIGRYADAEPLFKYALATQEKLYGKNSFYLTTELSSLGKIDTNLGHYAEAERFYARSIAIAEASDTVDRPGPADEFVGLAKLYERTDRSAEAEQFFSRALKIREAEYGSDHPDVTAVLGSLAELNLTAGRTAAALEFSQKAVHGAVTALARNGASKDSAEFASLRNYFELHLRVLARARAEKIGGANVDEDAFITAQWADQSEAGAALAQMALRFGAPQGGALAALVREQQDTIGRRKFVEKRLVDEIASPSDRRGQREQQLREQEAAIDRQLAQINAQIVAQFPNFAALANPKPLSLKNVRALLHPDEAMVFIFAGAQQTELFAVTQDRFEWHTLAFGAKALSDKVAAVRRGTDLEAVRRSIDDGKSVLFNLGAAYDLYSLLLAPLETTIKEKHNLLLVPSGPLTGLPFHLLVTEKPSKPAPSVDDLAAYRSAAWLLKRQATTVLPSVSSLDALRTLASRSNAPKPMTGFADPQFGGSPASAPARGAVRVAARTRGYAMYWRGGSVDRKELFEDLPPLPETADEIKAVAANLGAAAGDIHLGADANETTVKSAPLGNYRVVYFATHGLVAGDVVGLAEPALALSIPRQPSAVDDGLLTASEVAQLKLNADWVVLSACNTAAAEKPGAEALSGLARAFFYAGARALLVSHWEVESKAAARIATATFAAMRKDKTAGRAEALRRAMIDYINDTSSPWNAYPGFWAPFSVVGEGAR